MWSKKLLGSICLYLGMSISLTIFAQAPLIDIREATTTWMQENMKKWDLKSFPKSIVEGNIYDRAYALAQLQIASPTLQALDLTYEQISNRCDGAYTKLPDVTNVFAKLPIWLQLYDLLENRGIVDSTKDAFFNQSCKEIYKCYYRDELEEKWIEFENLALSTDVVDSCMGIVETIFGIMYQRASTLERMKNVNYGDEFLLNARPEDGPFDLLLDAEAIGDVLYAHNDNPAEIHFYDMQSLGNYVFNDPDKLTPYPEKDPKKEERIDRLPPTNGISPRVPETATDSYPQKIDTPPAAPSSQQTNTPVSVPWWSISNALCEVPLELPPEDDQTLPRAEEENKQTREYNQKLSLQDEVAILLWSRMTIEQEESFGLDTRGTVPTPPFSPAAQKTADEVIEEVIDLGGDSLEEMKNKIQTCVEKFTDGDKASRGKILFKSITQPAEFTKCVFGNLCKEIGDPTGRGLFQIKICKELRKWHGIISNQPVKAIEEVVDEMLNVCTNLKESGALLEHNKTKDHLENKLMRIKFGNKFAFGMSVIFKWPRESIDPGIAKRLAVEHRKYLEEYHLDMTDDLTFVKERNKYLLLQSNGLTRVWFEWNTSNALKNQQIIEALQKTNASLEGMASWFNETNIRASKSQLNMPAQAIDGYAVFLEQNILMRQTANQYIDFINKRRKTTLSQFQASSWK